MNTLLAEQLRRHSLSAKAERRSREGTPDVRVELRSGDLLLLECKWEGSAGLLDEQIFRRLEQFPEALGILGVVYPDRLQSVDDIQASLSAADDLRWRLHGSRGAATLSQPDHYGSVENLAAQLRHLPLDLEGADRVDAAAAIVSYAVDKAVQPVRQHLRLAERIADIIAKADKENDRLAALHIGCLVLFNALAFQDRLAESRTDVPTAKEALRKGPDGIQRAWQSICDDIDYVPVFEIAGQIADVLQDVPGDLKEAVINPLIQAAEDTRLLEGHDLAGRLFHTLLTDAKFTGAYYTSVPAATMLSRLVFEGWPQDVDWSDHEFPASLRVADLACGTGTLLMAVAAEAQRRHEAAGGLDAPALHKAMVEQALHGYDVQLSAIHFAATSLAMLNPKIQFDHMNLYVMPFGAEGSEVSLGSLDFLGTSEATVQYALSAETLGIATQEVERVSGRGTRAVGRATLPDLDLAIMNPPFTRSVGGNLLFGSLPEGERRILQDELSRRLKERQATVTAGLGAPFVAAAAPKLRRGKGRLALVLPATVCTGPSWEQTRALIQQDFVLDLVVTSHDPLQWNFSDSTDLSESLLIATRRPEEADEAEHHTTFANLWRNPTSVSGAHLMAHAIANTTPASLQDTGTALLEIDGQHVGELVSIPEASLSYDRWPGVQFARTDVLRCALSLLRKGEVLIPGQTGAAHISLCRLGELGRVGPDRRDMWDGFQDTPSVTAYPMVANHNTEVRRSIATEPDRYLAPLTKARPGRRLKPLQQLWEGAGQLLVAERLWLNTTRTIAMRTDRPVLSNVWWPVRTENRDLEKALTLWLNSSLGILTLLANRTSTRGAWVALKKTDLVVLPVLDVRALTAGQLQGLVDLFDLVEKMEFERLPQMADCPARRALDDGLSSILGLPDLSGLRKLLATEPVVSDERL